MSEKILKFVPELCPKILDGSKTTTWRINDEKGIVAGDILVCRNSVTGQDVAKVEVVYVREKKLGEVNEMDFEEGHERYPNLQQMYASYRSYYGPEVGPESPLKIIKFKLISEHLSV